MAKRLSRIPKHVHSMAGPVRVIRVKALCHEGRSVYGLWDPDARVISIEAKLGLETAHQTLRHEQFHAWVDDLGIMVPKEKLEALCEAYAVGRMGEWWLKR